MNEQLNLKFLPRVGEIWVCWGEIVMITRVGSDSNGIFHLPDCLEFLGLGYAEYDGPGRWWEVDYKTPSYSFERNRMDDGPRRMDQIYFKPWNGRGVFFCTKDGERASSLLSRWHEELTRLHKRKAKHRGTVFTRDRLEDIEAQLGRLFSKKIADEGFK